MQAAQRRETLFGRAGVTVLLAGLTALLWHYDRLFEPWAWRPVILTVAALVPLVLLRRLWTQRRIRLSHSIDWLQQASRRLGDHFDFGQGDGREYLRPDHPNASDLDLFGEASLFWRLNSCRTALGRDALATSVAGAPPGNDIDELRAAVEELAANVSLREALELELRALEYRGVGDERDREALDRSTRSLLDWMRGETPPSESNAIVAFHAVAGIAASIAFVVWATTELGLAVLAPFYLFNGVLLFRQRDVEELVGRFERVRDTLEAWSRVLGILETMQVHAPLLRRLQAAVASGDSRSSDAVAQLRRLADGLSQRRNVVWLLSLDVLWLADLHLRRALLSWKREHGRHMSVWFSAAADFEALCALATYRAAVPEAVFAEISRQEAPLLEFEELAHPLLPAASRVGNTLTLAQAGMVCVVTGSNMSGKSTFLRTTGVAVVMSRMGLPLPARRFRMREELQVVTCMNVHDSLKDASSLFHAEVRRLRQCLDWAEKGPATLVLFDEILAGTNSRERHIGAVAIVEALQKLPAVSLVSTHDLALAGLASHDPGRLWVVHFRDHVVADQMTFDYTLRPGPLPSTNAVRVMRLAGLPV